jgi:hypothetical protein
MEESVEERPVVSRIANSESGPNIPVLAETNLTCASPAGIISTLTAPQNWLYSLVLIIFPLVGLTAVSIKLVVRETKQNC